MHDWETRPKRELATEYPPPDEQLHIKSLIDQLRRKMEQDYAAKRTLRDAHPKMHGCVRAEFAVEPGLPDELRIGVFREPRTFPAWVRFSNQNGTVSPDSTKDIRGAAIKLMGVEGEKLLDNETQQSTQDFILISDDRFVTKDIAEFDALVKALIGGALAMGWFFFNPFNSHLRVLRNLIGSLRRHNNPLEIRYYSVSPYLLGSRAVKYSLKPRGAAATGPSENPTDDNYLREAMIRTLSATDAVFDFMVQFQLDPYEMPIEDPGVTWSEERSPFRKVGTLTIPSQAFDSPQQREFGDNLSFNPWHCLPEHRPLGGINRARRQIYQSLSFFRHRRNAALVREPSADEVP
jgi:hypothetical protein